MDWYLDFGWNSCCIEIKTIYKGQRLFHFQILKLWHIDCILKNNNVRSFCRMLHNLMSSDRTGRLVEVKYINHWVTNSSEISLLEKPFNFFSGDFSEISLVMLPLIPWNKLFLLNCFSFHGSTQKLSLDFFYKTFPGFLSLFINSFRKSCTDFILKFFRVSSMDHFRIPTRISFGIFEFSKCFQQFFKKIKASPEINSKISLQNPPTDFSRNSYKDSFRNHSR